MGRGSKAGTKKLGEYRTFAKTTEKKKRVMTQIANLVEAVQDSWPR